MPPIQNGLICQQCGSVGMTSFQRELLAKRFCVCTNHLLPFPQPGGLPGQVHIKSTKSTSNPPGGLPDQVSPPWRAFQLQTLRSHTQGFIIKWRGCHLSQGAIEHYIEYIIIITIYCMFVYQGKRTATLAVPKGKDFIFQVLQSPIFDVDVGQFCPL